MSRTQADRHTGSTFDSFLEEENLLHEAELIAVKRVFAWQLEKAMKAQRVSKRGMAKRLKTSRSQVDRLLDPTYVGVTLRLYRGRLEQWANGCSYRFWIVRSPPRKALRGLRAPAVANELRLPSVLF